MSREADITNSQIEFLPDGGVLRTTESEVQVLDADFHLRLEIRPAPQSVVFLSDEYSSSRRNFGPHRYRSDGLVEIWDPASGALIGRKDFELPHWIRFLMAIVLGSITSLAAQVLQYRCYQRFSLAHFMVSLVSLHCIAYNFGAIKISAGLMMATCILIALYLVVGRAAVMDRAAVSAALLGVAFVGPACEISGYRFENVVALIGSIPLSVAAIRIANLAHRSNMNLGKNAISLLGLFYLMTAAGLWMLVGRFFFRQYADLFSTAWCISLLLHITCFAFVILGMYCATGRKRYLFGIGVVGVLAASGFAWLLPLQWQRGSSGRGGMSINPANDGNVLTEPYVSLFIMGSLLTLAAMTNATSTNEEELVEPSEHM